MPRKRYSLQSGQKVVGVTTVTGELDLQGLIKWANNLGLDGISQEEYVNTRGNIGTLAHKFIEAFISGEDVPKKTLDKYTGEEIKKAKNCLKSAESWLSKNNIIPLLKEASLVSEKYHYGGTPDLVGYVNGELSIVDFKSGNYLGFAVWLQLVAYGYMVQEIFDEYYPKLKIKKLIIVQVPRVRTESFNTHELDFENTEQYFKAFRHYLAGFYIKRFIEKGY